MRTTSTQAFSALSDTGHATSAYMERGEPADWGSSDMHIRGCDCDECCPGTKAKATRVYTDATRIGPRVLTRERRLECTEANQKWLAQPGAREKARAAKREYHRRQAALRIIQRAAVAMGANPDRTPGAAP